MTALPRFPAGTLPIRRHDESETRAWLGPATLRHADRVHKTWRAILAAQRTMDHAWDWRAEVRAMRNDPNRLVLAVCEGDKTGRVHGMMNLILQPRASRLDRGADLLYIDMLAVAPWNRPAHPARELRGLGTLLVQAAILVSREAGLEGAFGLHSLPDPNTHAFYVDAIGMTPVGIEATPEGRLLYFESSPHGADAFLDRDAA